MLLLNNFSDSQSQLKLKYYMNKEVDSSKQQNTKKISMPKRRLQKSLPLIQNKKVPIHQIQSRKTYLRFVDISPQPQPKLWAYVPLPTKMNDTLKYHMTLSNSKAGVNPESTTHLSDTLNPSMTLLDKYFQRKHKKRLREVVKFIEQTSEQTDLNVGLEQISIFETILNKKDNDLSSSKKMKFQRIDALFKSTKAKQRQRLNGLDPHFHSYIQNYKNSKIDDYFQQK